MFRVTCSTLCASCYEFVKTFLLEEKTKLLERHYAFR